MASKTQIVNVALMRIGVSKSVGNVETDSSREALSARLLFDDDRDFVLRDFPWPFATAYATLGLVGGSSSDHVNLDWTFSYRYPSDCMFVRRILTPSGRSETSPPAFRIGRDSQGKLIYTNEEDAQIEYTASITEPEEFDAMFSSMLSWKLAAGFSPSMSRIKDMAKTCMEMYEIEKVKAQSRALNEGQQEAQAESEFTAARY